MKYSEIRDSLDTGDIVLFSGKGRISGLIKWVTKSPWSHVGMVLRLPEYDLALLWESTTLSKLKDITSGEARQGVQLVPLSERLRIYDGDVGIRKLSHFDKYWSVDLEALMKFRQEVKDRPYEESKLELMKSAYDGPLGQNEEDLSSLFCSELVAEAYQRIGLLREGVASNEYTPADFGGRLDLKNAVLEETIILEA